MATVIYKAPDGDARSVQMFGFEFFHGHPVEVTDAKAIAKLKSNWHFEVADIEAVAEDVTPEEAPKRRGRPPKAVASDEMEGGE